jgi:hypothetical protein
MFKKIAVACLIAAPILANAQVIEVSDAALQHCSIISEIYLSVAIDRDNGVPKIIEQGNVVEYNTDFSHAQLASMIHDIDVMYDHPKIRPTEVSSHAFWVCVRKSNKEAK